MQLFSKNNCEQARLKLSHTLMNTVFDKFARYLANISAVKIHGARVYFSQVFRLAVYSGHVAQCIRAMFAVRHSTLSNVFSGGDKSGTRANTECGAFYYHFEKVIRVSMSVTLAALFYEKLRPNVSVTNSLARRSSTAQYLEQNVALQMFFSGKWISWIAKT